MRILRQEKLAWLRRGGVRRAGAAALDYVLVLCVVLPLATFMFWIGPRIMRLTYEMVCVLVSWPFM
jgi:hypothetical protein